MSDSHVLVVEDDADISGLITTILKAEGYEVTAAPNGLDALKLLRAGLVPCLILLDLERPGMSGRELKAELAADVGLKDIPVAIMSTSRENLKAFQGCLRPLKVPATPQSSGSRERTRGLYQIEQGAEST